jgi:hypothetical protein
VLIIFIFFFTIFFVHFVLFSRDCEQMDRWTEATDEEFPMRRLAFIFVVSMVSAFFRFQFLAFSVLNI